MFNAIRAEFKRENLKFRYDFSKEFSSSFWENQERTSILYLAFKFCLFSFYLVLFTIYFNITLHIPFYVKVRGAAYLTNWTFTLCIFSSLLGLVTIARCYVYQNEGEKIDALPDHPKLFCIYWLTHSVAVDFSLAVLFIYFSFIFFYMKKPYYWWGLIFHFLFPTATLLDFIVVRMQVKLLHGWSSLVLGFTYGIFHIVYHFCGGKSIMGEDNIYPIFDWKNNFLKSFSVGFLALIVLVLCRIIVFWIYLCKLKIKGRLLKQNEYF